MKTQTLQKGGQPAAITRSQTIKLGLDTHADSIVVVRITDGQGPQPAQRFTPEKCWEWIQKQVELAEKVYACYEAGPLGYGLQRKLSALGLTCYVVRPRNWDEYGSKVRTDQRDAHELALCLDRYVSGNQKAFSVVRVPTPEEEERRSETRFRQTLRNEMHRLAAQGRGTALYYGYRLRGPWWKGAAWEDLQQTLPAHLLRLLNSLRTIIEVIEQDLKRFTLAIEKSAPEALPAGVGKLTAQMLEREVGDWSRFKNRRQVASYTGLCPSEETSGPNRFQGSVNKHGNRRIRPWLVECAWRLVAFQPEYRLVQKWRPLLNEPKATKARRKKIIVAMARQFAVDWWRIRTGRVTAQSLGLI